jgi:hypothetical protein
MEPCPYEYDKMARVPIDYIYAKMSRGKLIDEINRKYRELSK